MSSSSAGSSWCPPRSAATRRARSPSGSPPRWRRPLRLALLSALSTAAEEITSQLAPGSVDVRLRGGDLGFVVTARRPPTTSAPGTRAGPGRRRPAPDAEDGGTARITLRLPEQLKARVEDAAGREGFSVNNWLVRAVTRGLEPSEGGGSADRRKKWSGQHYSGWVR